jgi:hypothetical protein
VRALLVQWPKMPCPVVAQRIDWPYSQGPLKKLLVRVRPEYVGIDPMDRGSYQPGQITQCDLWFPDARIPVAAGQNRVLLVLVMALGMGSELDSRFDGQAAGLAPVFGLGTMPYMATLAHDHETAGCGCGDARGRLSLGRCAS